MPKIYPYLNGDSWRCRTCRQCNATEHKAIKQRFWQKTITLSLPGEDLMLKYKSGDSFNSIAIIMSFIRFSKTVQNKLSYTCLLLIQRSHSVSISVHLKTLWKTTSKESNKRLNSVWIPDTIRTMVNICNFWNRKLKVDMTTKLTVMSYDHIIKLKLKEEIMTPCITWALQYRLIL